MHRAAHNSFRRIQCGRFSALAALALAALLFSANSAKAACAIPAGKAASAPAIPFVSPKEDHEENESRTIVGLWHVLYTANFANGPFPPPPFQFLESYKTWHADGTEFENAFLAPSGGNICFGVWKDTKDGAVKLHHIGLMFNTTTGDVSNVFTVDEIDCVSRDGKTYTGSFDFKLFPPTDVFGTGTPLAEVKGSTAATRITVD